MNLMKCFLIPLLVIATFTSARAFTAPNIYQCQVVTDGFIKADGSLDLVKNGPRIGQRFTVIKKTGEIIGDVMDSLKSPRVITLGDEQNSYKVIWEQKSASKNGYFIDYLNIDVFAKGLKKPFGFFSGSLILTGWCE